MQEVRDLNMYQSVGKRRMKLHRRYMHYLLLALLLCSSAVVFGQARNSGEVAGNVLDHDKRSVANATVTLKSEERGNVSTTTTNAQGEYLFNDVPQGKYTLTVTAPTFEKFIANHVGVDPDSHVRQDAIMKAGEVSAEVEVTAGTQSIDTQTATIGAVIDNNLVENLPIDGNNVVALAAMLPGVTDVSAPTTFTNDQAGPSFAVNGSRSSSNLFLFDGLMWNNLFANTGLNYPNHAALQAVAIQLNNFTAQYGRNSGSILNIISKSGTNAIHGEAFLSYQNGNLSAADYFTKLKPSLTQYQFGGAVGGPIIKDKLFYEAEYQMLISSGTVVADAGTLTYAQLGLMPDGVTPRPCDSTGSFASQGQTQCAYFGGGLVAATSSLHDPIAAASALPTALESTALSEFNSTWLAEGHTGTNPCVNVLQAAATGSFYLKDPEIPSVCFDPTIQNVIHHSEFPNPTIQTASGTLLGQSTVSQPKHEYGGNLRVDWNASAKHIVDFHFYKTYNNDSTTNAAYAGTTTAVASYEPDFNIAQITAGSVGDTWVMTPNILNVLRAGYKRYVYDVTPKDRTTLGDLGSQFQSPGSPSLPGIVVVGSFNLGGTGSANQHNVNEDIEATDSITYTHHNHNIQAGADYFRNQYLSFVANPGTFTFNNVYTANAAAEFMMGLLYSEVVGNDKNLAAVQHAIYSFVQDQWRALPKLTITYGIRYELPFEWYQPKGYSETFVAGYQSTRFPNAPANLAFVGDPGVERALIKTDYSNLSPRIGIAYDVSGNGKTALRAGFGTFYDATPALIVGIGEPFYFVETIQEPPGSITNPLYMESPIPADYNAKEPPQFTSPQTIVFPDKNFRNSYTYGFNLGVQHQLNSGTTVEVNYIGRLSRHLTMPFDLNPAIRDCSGSYFQANPTLYCAGGPVTTGAYDPNPVPNLIKSYPGFSNIVNDTPGPQTMPTPQYNAIQATLTPNNGTSQGTLNTGYLGRIKYPGFNYGGQGIVDYSSTGTANYNAFQAIYTQRAFEHLTVTASYTYGKSLDEQTNISTTNATAQPNNLKSQYANSDLDTRQVFNMGFRLGIPNVMTGGSFKRALLNNWAVNGTYNARTGHYFGVGIAGDDSSNDEPNQRAELAPGQKLTLPSNRPRAQKIAAWFNCYQPTTGLSTVTGQPIGSSCANTFSQSPALSRPAPGTFGNVGRNSIVAPAYINTNMSLSKDIDLARVREGMRAQFRIETFNTFNTVNLGNPSASVNGSTSAIPMGTITTDTGGMRRLQFGALFYF